MHNYLTEFEDLDHKKSPISKWVMILFSISVAYYLSFIIIPGGFGTFSWSIFKSMETYFGMSIILLLPLFFLYLFYKKNNIGWFLITIIISFLFGLYFRVVYMFLSGTWLLPSIQRGAIVVYFLVHHGVLLLLLFHNKVRKEFKINRTFLVVSIFTAVLVFIIGLIIVG